MTPFTPRQKLRNPRIILPFLMVCAIGSLLSGSACTPKENAPSLTLGKPAYPHLSAALVNEFELSVRPLSTAAWRIRLQRESTGDWMLTERSDGAATPDLADSPLIEHFLKTLTTFTPESSEEKIHDDAAGFTPFRVELKLDGKPFFTLGDPTGGTGIYFRTPGNETTYVARGALVAFLGHLQNPASFMNKTAHRVAIESITGLEILKEAGPRWKFKAENGEWKSEGKPGRKLSDAQSLLFERLLHQRILRVLNESTALPSVPDWTLRISSPGPANGTSPVTEEIRIFFVLDQIFASNPARGKFPVEFYPEMAGTLRAFTQAGFTPVKSGMKE